MIIMARTGPVRLLLKWASNAARWSTVSARPNDFCDKIGARNNNNTTYTYSLFNGAIIMTRTRTEDASVCIRSKIK